MVSFDKLIEEILLHPSIYREEHEDYNNCETWKKIAAKLYVEQWDELTKREKLEKVEYLKKKWLELQSIYKSPLLERLISTTNATSQAAVQEFKVPLKKLKREEKIEIAQNSKSLLGQRIASSFMQSNTSNQNIMPTGSRSSQQCVAQHPLNTSHSLPSRSSNCGNQSDKDEQLLILYLLDTYRQLNTNDQREVLYSCHSIIQQRLLFYQMGDVLLSIQKEESKRRARRLKDELIVISDDEN